MKTIQPGYEVLSILGITSKKSATTRSSEKSFMISIVGAFFVVLILGMVLSFVQGMLSENNSGPIVRDGNERVAYQPGQYITSEINQGYLGN